MDVRGCRPFSEGSLGATLAGARSLPDIVVVGLGTNGRSPTSQIRAGLRILGRQRVLGLVTPKARAGGASSDQAVIRAAGRR